MLTAHRIALDPNNAQATCFRKAAGCARFAFNWALEEWRRQYQAGGQPSEAALRRQLNALKAADFPWLLDVPKTVPQQAIKNLGAAFARFFENVKHGRKVGPKKNPYGYPRFKKRGQHDSFRMDNGPPAAGQDAVKVAGARLYVPKLGWVRMCEPLRFAGQIKSAVISCTAGRWLVSLTVDVPETITARKNHGTVGVDLGINALATLSTGEVIDGPKPLRRLLKKLARCNRSLSRRRKGSAKFRKLRTRIARLHARMAHIRRDTLHKLTHYLASHFGVIGIEDLNVRGLLKNRRLARAIADMGWGEFRRQLAYKVARYGSVLVVAERWFPSSKTCSECHVIKPELALSERRFVCGACGFEADRDFNSAVCLEQVASSATTA